MRHTAYVAALFFLVGWAMPPLATAQVQMYSEAKLIWDNGNETEWTVGTVTAGNSGSIYDSLGPVGSAVDTYSYGSVEATVGASTITGSGYANAASNLPDDLAASGHADLHFNFALDSPTQLVLSYQLSAPATTNNYYGATINVSPGSFLGANNPPGQHFSDAIVAQETTNQKSGTEVLMVDPGNHYLRASAGVSSPVDYDEEGGIIITPTSPSPSGEVSFDFTFEFRDGLDQSNAFLPMGTGPNGGWLFTGVPDGGYWFDPVVAHGFEFEMLSESFFTVAGMPVGLGDPNGYLLTYFDGTTETDVTVHLAEGDVYNFPAGVSTFQVLDINPHFDPDDPLAFPIFLDFSTELANFTMTPMLVPEPGTVALLALGGLFLPAWRMHARSRKTSRRSVTSPAA